MLCHYLSYICFFCFVPHSSLLLSFSVFSNSVFFQYAITFYNCCFKVLTKLICSDFSVSLVSKAFSVILIHLMCMTLSGPCGPGQWSDLSSVPRDLCICSAGVSPGDHNNFMELLSKDPPCP
jgi:hypothetical protein